MTSIMDTASSCAGGLIEQQRQQFEQNGYLCPLQALNTGEVQHYLSCYLDYTAYHKQRLDALRPNQRYQVLSETHFVLPWVHEIVSKTQILDAMETLLGPNLLVWNTNWFSKMPGEKTYVVGIRTARIGTCGRQPWSRLGSRYRPAFRATAACA